ncbi:MAG: hypothetical protein ACLUTA_17300 [Blautia wexlerae]
MPDIITGGRQPFCSNRRICGSCRNSDGFHNSKRIGQDIDADFQQLKFTGGYDHNYVTDNYAKGSHRLIATAYSDKSKIAMDVTSDCPCVQFLCS